MKALQSRRLITGQAPFHQPGSGVVIIDGERVLDVCTHLPEGFSGEVRDFGDDLVMPGLIDCHVHINQPGRTEWEGYVSATQAAAAGGITTLVDMPLNCEPVTTSHEALAIKLSSLADQLRVDCGFWGGAIPNNLASLKDFASGSVLGIKAFMIDSGLGSFPPLNLAQLEQAAASLAGTGKPFLVHAELDQGQSLQEDAQHRSQPTSYRDFVNSRPKDWENRAIEVMIALARTYRCRVHIVHLSSAQALKSIQKAKDDGVAITVETCPHYLLLAQENIPDGHPEFKCCPPIREVANQEALWQALNEGVIDFVVSDHSPCSPHLKHLENGDLSEAWGGIASLQYLLPLMMAAFKRRSLSLGALSNILSTRQAKFLGLAKDKGTLHPGSHADFVVWRDGAAHQLADHPLYHKHKLTPYHETYVDGRVIETWLRGEPIYQNGTFTGRNRGRALV